MEIVTFEENKLVSEVQDVLNSWLNEKPEVRSVASLSRATGVADPAIRRLMNSNVKINDDAIFRLLSHVYGVFTFAELSSAMAGKSELLKWFHRHFAYLEKAPVMQEYKQGTISDAIAENAISVAIFSIVSSSTQISQNKVREQFGAVGEYELEKLIEKKIISISDGGYLAVAEKNIMLSKEQVVSLLPDLTRIFFKKDHAYNGRILNMESVSKEGYNKILDAVDGFNEQITSIAKHHSGDIPVITAGFFDTLTTIPYFEGGKNESTN